MENSNSTNQSFKILSYNIHKGFNLSNSQYTLDLIKEGLKESEADLLCLQEVCGPNTHPQKEKIHPLHTQFEFLADGVWSHYAYGKNAVYKRGDHGNAILSKYPIVAWHNLDLSTNRLEHRGLLHATIEMPQGKTLHVMTAHLDLREKGRIKQIYRICEYIKHSVGLKDKILLSGDFNDWRQNLSRILKEEVQLDEVFLKQYHAHARTFPSFAPILRLDRIYYRNFNPLKALCFTGDPWKSLSDHNPLYAEFST